MTMPPQLPRLFPGRRGIIFAEFSVMPSSPRLSLTKTALTQHRGTTAWWWWPSSAAERLRRRAAAKRLQCQAKSALPLPPLAPGLDAAKESDIAVASTVEELVARVKAGTLSSYEVVSVMAKRARECGGAHNAVTEELYDEALTEAQQKDRERALTPNGSSGSGVLEGMPISIKDHVDVKGTDSTAGVACRCFQPMPKDALVVELLRDAGAIVLCKTNVPQCLMLPETHNNIWGTTSTPWDVTRAAGGSSGGEAALIAVRGSLLGVGTDIGKSWWGRKEGERERAALSRIAQ